VASVAAGVDRCAGAALRLLPERHVDPGGRSAQHDEESDRGSDPDGDERPSVPVWDVSADPDGDQAGRRGDGEGREMMGELSRKTFLKGGGALIVGFSMAGAGLAGKLRAADSPYASNGPFDQYQVDAWITINADSTASIKSGGILQGTGSDTGLLMIAGEELNMGLDQVEFVRADTNVTPNSGKHSASNTIKNGGPGVRAAAAAAAQALLGLASTQLGVPAAQLSVSKGVVSGGGKSVTYGQLLGGERFNVQMPAS